jgi:DNA-binding NarL/FixJ family response regulator
MSKNPYGRPDMNTKIASTISVLMAEDESLFGELIQYKLSTVPGIEVSGIAKNGDTIVDMARQMKPDAMIVDSTIAGNMSGVEVAIEIKEAMPAIGMVLLTSY